MSALSRNPTNKNFLSPLSFRFVLLKAPSIEYFVQNVNIPALDLPEAPVPTPFVKLPVPGDHLQFGSFSVTFKIDEDMTNYLEIFDWMVGLGFPNSFEEYRTNAAQPSRDGIYSDASLIVLTSQKNPNIEIKFKNIWPTSLDTVSFDTTATDIEYVNTTATFKYQSFNISRL